MGMALAAIADDGDLLAFDEIEIGIAIVVNAHKGVPCLKVGLLGRVCDAGSGTLQGVMPGV